MPTNAVKVTYGATEIIFYTDEVIDTQWGQYQNHQVHIRQSEAPVIKYIDNVDETLSITFDIQNSTTLTNVDLFLECGEELTVYYSMVQDDTAHLHCVPLRNGVEDIETFGQSAVVQRRVEFVKTSA